MAESVQNVVGREGDGGMSEDGSDAGRARRPSSRVGASSQLKSTGNVAVEATFKGGTVVMSVVSGVAAAVGLYCAVKMRMDSVLDGPIRRERAATTRECAGLAAVRQRRGCGGGWSESQE